jgi:hypothetical protein
MAPRRTQRIDSVWAGHPVGFDIVADSLRLYVGYYDTNRRLTIASRKIEGGRWFYRRFDSHLGWDSHNHVALAIDPVGRLHMAANMHVSPLDYHMMTRPGILASMGRIGHLIDPALEGHVTYPRFLHMPDGRLIFTFRNGGSGNGDILFYAFDDRRTRWSNLLNSALLDGEGLRNAYPVGPIMDASGQFHFVWVWRDNRRAETNHDLCHARSTDLANWRRADGRALPTPITLKRSPVVDPVPVGGGMINNNTLIGFDRRGRAMISYHKYDASGDTQIYLARWEARRWRIVQASRWTGYRWHFGGGGTLHFDIVLGPPQQQGDRIMVPVTRDGRDSLVVLEADSLIHMAEVDAPAAIDGQLGDFACRQGMEMHCRSLDAGPRRFLLAWSTMPSNRDRPRRGRPRVSDLMLVEWEDA